MPPSPCPASAASFACIFLRAAKIISSLLFCNSACLSLLFALHADFPPAMLVLSALSAPWSALAILAERLYRVIRSGCDGFGVVGLFSAVDVDEEDAGIGSGGWNVCGGFRKVSSSIRSERARRLTVSSPLPLSILSVVAATLPPFLWRSHMMVRLAICGNICCILSTSASRARRLLALEVDCDAREEAPLKKNHRIAIPPMKRTRRSCGMLIVCSSAILADLLPVVYCSSKKKPFGTKVWQQSM
jgi:hypothetical protein